ncbi:tetratricopeptide repeat protein [Phreatobacter stygius]|uniref:Tetratricopeptide repeat protein n=1 Tax=Phreatobacter stygius TaxID=1940610 RepID=A0A4D7B166_9HYPH|nr:tetratricopeptide repeat protein [Phreatobacter stygius]QCI64488.1 tetratricopeptide repeat protein [Phreatobacter stygius]
MLRLVSRPPRKSQLILAMTVAALALAGCTSRSRSGGGDVTGSVPVQAQFSEQQARQEIDGLAARYQSSPQDANNAMRYGRALRATGQAAQAVAVLERVAIRDSRNLALLGEYGRALADTGRYEQAMQVLTRAQRPDMPDWRIVNVQGSILDQMSRHDEAQKLYEDALRIAPGQPAVLSNLGLSLALSRKLPQAEQLLRQAAAHPAADRRVRQNLALVIGLQGRFGEAEELARKDLAPAEAEQNVAYLRSMLARQSAPPPARSRPPAPAARG